MLKSWPDAVERVADFLRRSGAESRLEELGEVATARAAARAAGCGLDQIVKSIVLVCDGRAVLALVPGDRRADPRKVAAAAGAAGARVATAEEVEAATGFAPGAVAPFPHAHVERVLVDRSLLAHRVVWVGAGSARHLAALAPADLVRLTRATTIDAVEDSLYDSAGSKGDA